MLSIKSDCVRGFRVNVRVYVERYEIAKFGSSRKVLQTKLKSSTWVADAGIQRAHNGRGCVMSLEQKLDALIARQDHVNPKDVTLEYIRHQRDQKGFYNNVKFDFSTRYGGYVRTNRTVLTPSMVSEVIGMAYGFLASLGRK